MNNKAFKQVSDCKKQFCYELNASLELHDVLNTHDLYKVLKNM